MNKILKNIENILDNEIKEGLSQADTIQSIFELIGNTSINYVQWKKKDGFFDYRDNTREKELFIYFINNIYERSD